MLSTGMRYRSRSSSPVSGPTRTAEILEVLLRHEIELVVVGMTAAVLQGAPALTFDLHMVYSREPAAGAV